MTLNLVSPLPTVSVGGRIYSVKYSHAALYLLSEWGVDLDVIFQSLNQAFGSPARAYVPATETTPEILARDAVIPNGQANALLTKISAAALGTVGSEGIFRSANITPLDLAERMIEDEPEQIGKVCWPLFAKKIGLELPQMPTANPAPTAADTANSSGSTSGPSEPPNPA